jgi:hypothetical protein
VASALSLVFGIEPEVHQRIVALARFHDDIAAASAISAGGATAWNKFFTAEGHAAVTTVTGFYPDSRFINKHFSCLV